MRRALGASIKFPSTERLRHRPRSRPGPSQGRAQSSQTVHLKFFGRFVSNRPEIPPQPILQYKQDPPTRLDQASHSPSVLRRGLAFSSAPERHGPRSRSAPRVKGGGPDANHPGVHTPERNGGIPGKSVALPDRYAYRVRMSNKNLAQVEIQAGGLLECSRSVDAQTDVGSLVVLEDGALEVNQSMANPRVQASVLVRGLISVSLPRCSIVLPVRSLS